MTDLISQRLPILKSQRYFGINDEQLIFPNYNGNSILNIPPTLCHLLQIPEFGENRLDKEILDLLKKPIRNIIFILMDGLALHRLQRWINDGRAPIWKELVQQGVLAPLTSVAPSTTTTAITSLWTGTSPKTHGIIGYELWLKEFGIVTNMISHSPISYYNNGNGDNSLTRAGFKPEEYLQLPTLGAHFQRHGIQTLAFQHYSIAHSGLSQMVMNNVPLSSFSGAAELWTNVRKWLEQLTTQRACAWIYWSEVDHLSHQYGPDDERPAAEFSAFSQALERDFLNKTSSSARRGTVIILSADHGALATPLAAHNELQNHPFLDHHLHIKPSGENRLVYLHIRPGGVKAVRDYIEGTWQGKFHIFNSIDLAKSEFFGSGKPHPDLQNRLGDLVLLGKDNQYLWWANKANPLLGRHGGLHPEEMLVPFLAINL